MGDCLILHRKITKIKFENIKLKEINTYGISESNLSWTANEDCVVVCVGATDTTTRGYNTVSVSGTHADLYKNTAASFFCYVGELSSGSSISVGYSPYKVRMLVKLPVKHLKVELLKLQSNVSSGSNQAIDAIVGTTSKSGTITPKKGDAYIAVGAMGYHDGMDPNERGVSMSFTDCQKSYMIRGTGSKSANGGNGEQASSVTTSSLGWCALGISSCILNSNSSSFQAKSYLYNSYEFGSWTAAWVFKIS